MGNVKTAADVSLHFTSWQTSLFPSSYANDILIFWYLRIEGLNVEGENLIIWHSKLSTQIKRVFSRVFFVHRAFVDVEVFQFINSIQLIQMKLKTIQSTNSLRASIEMFVSSRVDLVNVFFISFWTFEPSVWKLIDFLNKSCFYHACVYQSSHEMRINEMLNEKYC